MLRARWIEHTLHPRFELGTSKGVITDRKVWYLIAWHSERPEVKGIGEAAPHTQSITLLVEQVRGRLARQLSFAHRGDDGALPIITMSAEWENAFADALIGSGDEKQLALAPSRLQEFIRGVRDSFERAALNGDSPVLLTSPQVRPYVRSIIERFRGQTPVMSQNEVHPKARLKTVGTI